MTLDDILFGKSINGESVYKILEEPNIEEAAQYINRFKFRRMILVFANCVVNYVGRAKSFLSQGDRLIILKPDGTLLIHENSKVDPVNWQPPGSVAKAYEKDGKLVILSKRPKPIEKVEIIIEYIHFMAILKITKGKFELFGSEKDLVDTVIKNPNLIEEGLKILRKEAPTPYGNIDLVGEDREGNIVLMEFKRSTANFSAALQLLRYVTYYKKVLKKKTRGILVAPEVTENALIFLRSQGLEFKKIKPI